VKLPQAYGAVNDEELADATVTTPPVMPLRNDSCVPISPA
jgi:hypothetical protein